MPRSMIASVPRGLLRRPTRLYAALRIVACAALMVMVAGALGRQMLWNLTSSMPRGLYLVKRSSLRVRGAIVSVRPPDSAAMTIYSRRYLPHGVGLLKHILALPGDHVCIDDRTFLVDGRLVGHVAQADAAGRPLRPFHFCGLVPGGSAVVGTLAPFSYDSRYFGPVPLSSLTVVEPLWTF
jgi:conjugative transfer signal peptidase TraF